MRRAALILAAVAAPSLAGAQSIVHVPPAEVEAGTALVLEAEVDRAWEGELIVRYRAQGRARWHVTRFEKTDDGFLATLPATVVEPPGVEYFIDGAFATAQHPHRVAVYESDSAVRVRRELDHVRGRRARARVAGEWVSYGARDARNTDGQTETARDLYYRLEADFTYRVLRFPLYSIRFGTTRLLGRTPVTRRDEDACGAADCELDTGFRAGGWFELRFRARRATDLDLRGMALATPTGFGLGARGELRFGDEYGSHVALGVEAIADVGRATWFRLGWDTVDGFPMAATVELTDFPASHRATGVRLLFDIHHPFDSGLRLGARAGYQARDQQIGGATLGASASFEF